MAKDIVILIKRFLGKSNIVRLSYFYAGFIIQVFANDFLRPGKAWLFLRILPYTMVGYKRIKNVHTLARAVFLEELQGAFVECGVWKGGTIGVMAHAAKETGSTRAIWLFDSFEGLPEPTKIDGAVAKEYAHKHASGELQSIGECVGPLEDVHKLFFRVLKIPEKYVKIQKGWFQNTIPHVKGELGDIAILRIDADWYESTQYVLEQLYDQVVSGGYVVIDDYGHWEGCKKAVDEFRTARGIDAPLKTIDYTGVYFRKP